MDIAAIAETTVEMWVLIDAKLKARKQENIEPELKVAILDKAMSLYITNIINEGKKGDKTPAEMGKIEPPSKAQLDYAADLGITNARTMSKQELSKAIDEALNN